ncbi:MAG: hypothetical protein IBX71_06120 [Candidatus Desulforudis sp.]|nr:hypothetical protein [Desulforudis sp.]
MTPKKKEKAKKKNKERDRPLIGTNEPIGADIAPDYVTEDLVGYRVPFNDKK